MGGTTMVGYLYDGDGTRVAKGTITPSSNPITSPLSCDPATNGFTLTGSYVVGAGGEELTQLNGSGQWQRTNVLSGGKQLATYDTNGLHYQIDDPLGTRRMQTNAAGQPETDVQSLPYGDALATANDEYAPATADDATPLHFTSKERDAESGNDYFGARYYESATARWLSPDWAAKVEPVPYAKMDDPQSLNLYSYVGNNPLARADKDGHCYPVCTALLGAGLGMLAEAGGEMLKGEHLSSGKILAAGIAGGVVGAIGGPIGDAAELGVTTRVVGQLAANLIGGAVERSLTGKKVLDGKEIVSDAIGAGVSAGIEKGASKVVGSEIAQKIASHTAETVIDMTKRSAPDKKPVPPSPSPAPHSKSQNN